MEYFYTYNSSYLKNFSECSKSRMPSAQYVYLKIGDDEEICFYHWEDIAVRLNAQYNRNIKEYEYYISFHVGNRAVKYEFFKLNIIDYNVKTEFYNPFVEDTGYFVPIDKIIGRCLINNKEIPFEITFITHTIYNRIFKKDDSDFKGVRVHEFYETTNSECKLKKEFDKKYEEMHDYLEASLRSKLYRDSNAIKYSVKSELDTNTEYNLDSDKDIDNSSIDDSIFNLSLLDYDDDDDI